MKLKGKRNEGTNRVKQVKKGKKQLSYRCTLEAKCNLDNV